VREKFAPWRWSDPLGAVTKTDVHLIDLDIPKWEERVPPVNLQR